MTNLAWVDFVLFCVMEGILLAITAYAVWKFYFRKLEGIPSGIRSGENSRMKFLASYGVVSVVVLQLGPVNTIEVLRR